jgi:DNA-binding transcriptional LysR family regulator
MYSRNDWLYSEEREMTKHTSLEKYVNHHLKIKHLRLLVELGDKHTVAKAAISLNVSQPAVSKMLSEMEMGFGVELFERAGRGIRPTVFGESLIRHAREVLFNLVRANEEFRNLSKGAEGRISIGILNGFGSEVLVCATQAIKQSYPHINIAIRENSIEQNLLALRSGKIDLFIGKLTDQQDGEFLEHQFLYQESMVLVASKTHPLSHRTQLEWSDLENLPWILPMEESPSYQRLMKILQQQNLNSPKNIIECVSRHISLPLLMSPPNIGLLPLSSARRYADEGKLQILPLSLPSLPAPISMMWNKSKVLPESVEIFKGFIKRSSEQFGAELNVN